MPAKKVPKKSGGVAAGKKKSTVRGKTRKPAAKKRPDRTAVEKSFPIKSPAGSEIPFPDFDFAAIGYVWAAENDYIEKHAADAYQHLVIVMQNLYELCVKIRNAAVRDMTILDFRARKDLERRLDKGFLQNMVRFLYLLEAAGDCWNAHAGALTKLLTAMRGFERFRVGKRQYVSGFECILSVAGKIAFAGHMQVAEWDLDALRAIRTERALFLDFCERYLRGIREKIECGIAPEKLAAVRNRRLLARIDWEAQTARRQIPPAERAPRVKIGEAAAEGVFFESLCAPIRSLYKEIVTRVGAGKIRVAALDVKPADVKRKLEKMPDARAQLKIFARLFKTYPGGLSGVRKILPGFEEYTKK